LSTIDAAPDQSGKLTISIDFPDRHSRLTTFFRLLLVIPLLIFAYVYEIVTALAVIVAWFAIVITGIYPAGLYAFVSGYVRFYLRLVGYLYLAVDLYPPFGGGAYPEYPVHVAIPERKAKYSRLKTFFRFIYILPAYLVVAVLAIGLLVVVVLSWLIILVTGRLPGFAADYLTFALGWLAKFQGLYFLLIENY
jgi:hypothetical protein